MGQIGDNRPEPQKYQEYIVVTKDNSDNGMKYGCGTENKKEEVIAINTITQKPTSVRKPGQSSQEFLSVQSTSVWYPSTEYVNVFYRVLQSFTSHAVFE